jgi:ribosomal-protein-alanine N-acetyltransferase
MLLTTKRLILRHFTHEDLNALALLLSNEKVMQFSLAGPLSFEKAKEYLENRILEHYSRYGFGLWALISKEDNRLVRLSGLMHQRRIGYRNPFSTRV